MASDHVQHKAAEPLPACKECGRIPKREVFYDQLELINYKIDSICGPCQRRAETASLGSN